MQLYARLTLLSIPALLTHVRPNINTYILAYSVDMPCNEETGGSLADLAKHASFGDPYIGGGQFAFTRFTRHHRSL